MTETYLGEIKKGREIGKFNLPSHNFIYLACEICGKERWLGFHKDEPQVKRCKQCQWVDRWGENHPLWKDGWRQNTTYGYILIRLKPGDFFYPMASSRGYVLEHRLIMAKSLGRILHLWEIVHHKNGIKDDNRIENLQLIQEMQHNQITKMETRIKLLEARVTQLEIENILLKSKTETIMAISS